MTYLEELRNRYKEARKRMEKHAIKEPRVNSLPPPMHKQEQEQKEKPAGLISEKANENIVCEALKITDFQDVDQDSQIYKMANELMTSPRLPPLPGLVLNEPGAVRWMRVMHAVAKHHKISVADIMSETRERHVVTARFEIFYRLRIDLAMSYTRIGKLFGKDHSTVMHGVNKIRQKLLDEMKKQAEYDRSLLVQTPDQQGAHT